MNTSIVRAFSKVGFQLKKHSPEILTTVGVVGTVASTVLACKATTKVSDILDDTKEKVEQVHYVLESDEFKEEEYSVEDSKKDLAIIYAQSGVKLAKLYAPAVALGVFSIGCMVGATRILSKRNVALAAAYATIDQSFKEYRGRVVERFGQELDRELRYNIKAKKVTETEIDEETGKEKKVKKNIEISGYDGYSEYARFFDECSRYWEKDPNMNKMFLRAQQQYANDLLISNGYLFLSKVYEMLGFEPTIASQTVGWVYDPDNKNIDSYVDFGISDIYRPREVTEDFRDGYERSVLLDFNVDGDILHSGMFSRD